MTIDKVMMMMMMMIAGSREILLYCTVMMKKNERGGCHRGRGRSRGSWCLSAARQFVRGRKMKENKMNGLRPNMIFLAIFPGRENWKEVAKGGWG